MLKRLIQALALSIATIPAAQADCALQGSAERAGIQAVLDGDTVELESGTRLRLIGVNTPEVAGADREEEPLAGEATAVVRQFLKKSAAILIQPGTQSRDRYGRLLAHVFDPVSGESLASHLLSRGLAWRVAVPPNLRYQDCLADAEQNARTEALGLWSAGSAQGGGALKEGFNLLDARITGISFNQSWWLSTDSDFVVQVKPADQVYFDRSSLKHWQSTDVELRGWMYNRSGSRSVARGYEPWVLILRHPSSIALAR